MRYCYHTNRPAGHAKMLSQTLLVAASGQPVVRVKSYGATYDIHVDKLQDEGTVAVLGYSSVSGRTFFNGTLEATTETTLLEIVEQAK